MPKDPGRHRFVAKLRVETCPRAEICANLRAETTLREIRWREPWNLTITNNMRTNFQTKWLVRSIDIIEKVEK